MSTIDLPQDDLLPLMAPLDALSPGDFWDIKLAELRQRVERGRTALKRQEDHFNTWFQEVTQRPLGPDGIEHLAKSAMEKGRAAAEILNPQIEELEQMLRTRPELQGFDILSLFRERLDTAIASIALYHKLHDRLLALAAQRWAAAQRVLHARPIEGEIDYAKLSREHMARYPKIRAALAK